MYKTTVVFVLAAMALFAASCGTVPSGSQSTIDNGPTVTNSIGMKLKLIPAGSFIMGSYKGDDKEKPVHKATISKPFYIGVYEVTQQQYEKVMKTNPSLFPAPNHPVENVSWDDVQQFCQKLSEMENHHYRLPTEAEWEYACRAGTTTKYYWGNEYDGDYAWSDMNTGQIQDVGMCKPNPWGLYDISGNVLEWCHDWYGPYETAEQIDPQGVSEGTSRILRGGSWITDPMECRSAKRRMGKPGVRYAYYAVGFRVVLDAM